MDKKKILLNYDKIIRTVANCCFLFILLFGVFGIIVSPDLRLFYEKAQIYDENWIWERSDDTTQSFTMPFSINLQGDEKATIKTILPREVEDGTYLAVNMGKSFKAYIGDGEIYEFDNTVSRIPGCITKTIIVPIPLKEEYAGKELTMVISNGKYERNRINSAYIGTLMGIAMLLIKSQALQFVMALLLVIASIGTIAIFAYMEKRDNRKAPLIYLAEGIRAISLWIVLDSHLFQLVFRSYFFDGVVGFMLVIILALPFLLYFDAITDYRDHKIYLIFETIIVVNFIGLTILHISGIRSYDKSLIYMDSLLIVYIGVILVCTLRDYIIRGNKSHKNVILGLIGLSAFSIFEIISTILSSNTPFKIDIGGVFILVGMIILLFFATLDQVRVFSKLRQETQNAIAATKAKSDFLANMSHEIRTPINAIMGMNEMILRESNQETVLDYAKDISSASENLLRIINDILDFSKIEAGKLEIVCDNYDLGELIYDVTSLVKMKADSKGLKLNISIDENLPSKLYGDDKRVREVITNVLNNAVKYTETGYVNLKISGKTFDEMVNLYVTVQDSGQGIKAEDIDKIFSGFSQVNVKKNRKIEGTGLGLSITKRLIELMNGYISVQSEYGKGSTFTMILPQQIVSREKMGNYMEHRHASVKGTTVDAQNLEIPNARILVVDDTQLNLKVMSKFLAKTKAQVTCASSGEEMLGLIQENEYDIIFLDHMMPNLDGIETLEASKQLLSNKCMGVPVIALTANAIVGAKEMYLEAGFNDYLSKPVKIEALYEMLATYLNG